MRLLLADALYADGPLLAWLKHVQGIDALVPLPEDRLLSADVSGLAAGGLIPWTEHRYTRTLAGHKQLRRVAVASAGDLTSWDGFVEAAASHSAPDATLWACLIRETDAPPGAPLPRCLVSTRPWADGFAALQAYRPRWHIEDDTYRELKEGWGLEEQCWGRDRAAARGHLTLTCLAFTTAQVYRTRAGEQMARRGIRRLRRVHQPAPRRCPRCPLRGGLLCRAGSGGPARRARPARARELAPRSGPTAATHPPRCSAAAPVCRLSTWTGGLTMPVRMRGPWRSGAASSLRRCPAPAKSAAAACRSGRALPRLSEASGLPACAPADVPVSYYLQMSGLALT